LTGLNQKGVASLRTFTVVRREIAESGGGQLLGVLSGAESPSPHLNCLIGLHGSWVWLNEFGSADRDGLTAVSFHSSEVAQEEDKILYLLPPAFQPTIAFILLDPKKNWEPKSFELGLAASSRVLGTDGHYLRRERAIDDPSQLEDGESLVVDGWDHEHCSLCYKHIRPGDVYFFHAWGEGGSYLCTFCHTRFALTHIIGEVIYPGEGDRVGERD
jgi:hypothetical protein